MSDDLITRLRTITSSGCNPYSACHEAAAELARLRAEVERLTDAHDSVCGKLAGVIAALSDERAHADALAETLESCPPFRAFDYVTREYVLSAHRARRQG